MRLCEFADSDASSLVVIADQLKTDLDNGKEDPNMSLTEFLKYLRKYDIIYDKSDLYNLIKKMPLKNLISNIKGDRIIFKGYNEDNLEMPDEKSKNIVANMAKKAIG